ncbi:MAG: Crp/Fnr family transcriptional regulator [Balneolaceae bacterium]
MELKIKKGEILQFKGELNTKIYHVNKGLLRSYSIDEKGKEHIFMFAPEGWTIADSLPPEEPADLFIDAIEDSIVIVGNKNIEKEKQNVAPLVRRIGALQKRVIMLMSYSALKRYDHFVHTYPEILQRVPQKMIASYLGITPEALSKLKNKKTKNQ